MSSLFQPADSAALVGRIQSLRPDTKPQWGKMSAAQMLAHCQTPLRVATGELKLKRELIGFLFGRIARKKLVGPQPFDRNLPTSRQFVVRDPRDFGREQPQLVALVQDFTRRGPAGVTREPHPFFGPMSTAEWDMLQWKHLDHHLRQFGV